MDFSKLFKETNWKALVYKEKLISIGDVLDVYSENQIFKVTIESTNSNWEQGVFFQSKNAHFFAANFDKINGFHLWQTESEKEILFKVSAPEKKIKVWNIWRIDGGPMQYG